MQSIPVFAAEANSAHVSEKEEHQYSNDRENHEPPNTREEGNDRCGPEVAIIRSAIRFCSGWLCIRDSQEIYTYKVLYSEVYTSLLTVFGLYAY